MTRKEKEQEVAWLEQEFRGLKGLFLTDFHGLTVAQLNKLRVELRNSGGQFKVLKNTLVRRASAGTRVELLKERVVGPRAAAWAYDEDLMPRLAKILADFAKDNPKMGLIGAVVGATVIDPEGIVALSKMPSKNEMLARLFGTMIAPVGAVVNTLAAIPRSLLNVLKAIEDQKIAASAPVAGDEPPAEM